MTTAKRQTRQDGWTGLPKYADYAAQEETP